MAGGLFGLPFTLNEKCIVFSLLTIALFLVKPAFKSKGQLYVALAVLFVVSYVSMAWYDYYYDCRLMPLRRGRMGLTTQLKPPIHSVSQVKPKLTKLEKRRMAKVIYASHVFVFVPLLLYVAYFGRQSGPEVFNLLLVLGVLTLGYHVIKLSKTLGKPTSTMQLAIYLTHIFVTAPLLIYVGLWQEKSNQFAYIALGALAMGALAFHFPKLVSIT